MKDPRGKKREKAFFYEKKEKSIRKTNGQPGIRRAQEGKEHRFPGSIRRECRSQNSRETDDAGHSSRRMTGTRRGKAGQRGKSISLKQKRHRGQSGKRRGP